MNDNTKDILGAIYALLAKKENIAYEDLSQYIEIAHADPYVPSLPVTRL